LVERFERVVFPDGAFDGAADLGRVDFAIKFLISQFEASAN